MQYKWSFLFSISIDVFYTISLRALNVYLHCGQRACLVHRIYIVELELQHEIEEPLVPEFNKNWFIHRFYEVHYEVPVLLIEIPREANGHFIIVKIDTNV